MEHGLTQATSAGARSDPSLNKASSPHCHQKPRGCASPTGVESDCDTKIKVLIEIIFF